MPPWPDKRPETFADCQDRPMPCPWVGCKHHTLLDVVDAGSIVINSGMLLVPGGNRKRPRPRQVKRRLPVWREAAKKREDDRRCTQIADLLDGAQNTCVLKMVANEKTHTLDEIGQVLNVSRERVRQIEESALRKIRKAEKA